MTPELLPPELLDATADADIDANADMDADADNIITELDISHLVIEDDTPVDNFQSEGQQRLLVEPLHSADALPTPFLAAANVGLFYQLKGEPIVPDMMLSLGVQRAADFSQKRYRSYFVWEFGKVPDVCIEIVSNSEGDELRLSQKSRQRGKPLSKKEIYAQIGVRYYGVFDPLRQIQGEAEMNGALLRVWAIAAEGYTELTPPAGIRAPGQMVWLNGVGLGLTLWEGAFEEEITRLWLRWCDREGQVIPTGAERAKGAELQAQEAELKAREAELQAQEAELKAREAELQAQEAELKAERLAERLRAMGINPDEV